MSEKLIVNRLIYDNSLEFDIIHSRQKKGLKKRKGGMRGENSGRRRRRSERRGEREGHTKTDEEGGFIQIRYSSHQTTLDFLEEINKRRILKPRHVSYFNANFHHTFFLNSFKEDATPPPPCFSLYKGRNEKGACVLEAKRGRGGARKG